MDAAPNHFEQERASWIALCAHRLRERFPRLPVVTLEETAEQLLEDERLRGLTGVAAAERWLSL